LHLNLGTFVLDVDTTVDISTYGYPSFTRSHSTRSLGDGARTFYLRWLAFFVRFRAGLVTHCGSHPYGEGSDGYPLAFEGPSIGSGARNVGCLLEYRASWRLAPLWIPRWYQYIKNQGAKSIT
jgi:hypothetical protein